MSIRDHGLGYVDPNQGFTQRASRRNLHDWPYAHVLYKGNELLIETVHKSLHSLRMEVETSAERVRKGEATHINVDGVPRNEWQAWIAKP